MTGDLPDYERSSQAMAKNRAILGDKFARQNLALVEAVVPKPLAQLDVLDVGSGYGYTASALARSCGSVVGIEASSVMWQHSLGLARGIANLDFVQGDICEWNTGQKFDLVFLDNVYEHLPNQVKALERIDDLLATNGILLIIVPNRLWPIEPHYRLPFLSYLPLPLATLYLRLTRKGTDYRDASYAPTLWSLRRVLRKFAHWEFAFVLPADLSLTQTGSTWIARAGLRLLASHPSFWAISKAFVLRIRKTAARE